MNASLDLISARSALNSGHPDVARALLVGVVRAEPRNGQAWHLLGQAVTDPAQQADCQMRAAAAGYHAAPPPALADPQPAFAPVDAPLAPIAAQTELLSPYLPAAGYPHAGAYPIPARRAPASAAKIVLMLGAGALAVVLFLCVGAALLTPREIQLGGGAPVANASGDLNRTVYDECVDSVGRFIDDQRPAFSPYERSTVQAQGGGSYLVRGSVSYRENGRPVSEAWNCTASPMNGGWMTVITN